jgi:hypothetical protein
MQGLQYREPNSRTITLSQDLLRVTDLPSSMFSREKSIALLDPVGSKPVALISGEELNTSMNKMSARTAYDRKFLPGAIFHSFLQDFISCTNI